MDQQVKDWQEAAGRADELASAIKAHIDLGQTVPAHLLAELAVREDRLLAALTAMGETRPTGTVVH